MNAIYGICRFGDVSLHAGAHERLEAAIARCVGGTHTVQHIGQGVGWLVQEIERPSYVANILGCQTVMVAGRVDNGSELSQLLDLSAASPQSDAELIRLAYDRWGEGCVERLQGDWVFAAWNANEKKLILARSHYGCLPLYYLYINGTFAFATSRTVLLEAGFATPELNRLWLAQYMVSWQAYQGELTPHQLIRRLPPGHILTVNPSGIEVRRYWRPDEAAELTLSGRADYVEGFRSLFDEAVNCRLRDGAVASTLSGGLDSGSVTATAARLLAARGERLTAFTSVPRYDTAKYVTDRFGDEYPYACATAEFAGTVDLKTLEYPDTSPVAAIRSALQLTGVPCHGSGNLYWLLSMQRTVKEAGFQALLTGAAGNAGVSWTGDLSSQPWSFLFAHYSGSELRRVIASLAKERFKSSLPTGILTMLWKRRMEKGDWCRGTALRPDFAKSLNLLERRLDDPDEQPPRTPREQRARILMLGRSLFGAYVAELGAAIGLEIRDPTADARLLEFVLAVPDRIFMDPETGIDRWLIREAMKGRLPDQVRLNRSRGLQAADMVPRLRACGRDVEEALGELAAGPAAEFVDVEYMRQVWRIVQTEDSPRANVFSKQILLRGIMAGLFVNGFYADH